MRTLRFNVHAQAISRDPACDFGGLVAGSEGYLKAYFALDAAWKGCAVAASFWREGRSTPCRWSAASARFRLRRLAARCLP